ncbi:MAG: D-alanyl-D-alanine carboxypeptidase/D-alanyl-D-alanine-endopeptidase [Prolixibacteraceae bacterium]
MKKKALKEIVLFLIMFCFFKGHSQPVLCPDSLIGQWTRQQHFQNAGIGIYMEEASTGDRVGSFNPELSLVPASMLKLVTTATALEIMGPDYRFSTKLAFNGIIRNDSLLGDLIIVGGGDPALGSRYFKEHYLTNHFLKAWTDSLNVYHIRHISGNIITDATIYDDQAIPDTWIWEDLGNYFGAGVSGLSVYDNTCDIHLWSSSSAEQPTRITSINPAVPGLTFDNRVLSSDDQRDLAYIYGSPLDLHRVIRGSVPKGKQDFVIRGSIPNPARLLAGQLKSRMENEGITIGGRIKEATQKTTTEVTLATTYSPILADLIRITNHESVNLFAEHLLKHLAYLKTGVGSVKGGISVIMEFWKNKGLDTRGFFMCDGSGLSRSNALTARQMVGILAYMKNKSRYNELFFNSLPAVPDGTLYQFDARNFPDKSLRAKSGSMTRARCYAGWLRTASGREILFDISLNNFSCSQNTAIQAVEKLLTSLYGL